MNKIYGNTIEVFKHCHYGVIPEDEIHEWLDEVKGTRYFKSKT